MTQPPLQAPAFFSEADIRQVTETVWDLVLHMRAESGAPGPSLRDGRAVSGTVKVKGTWNGTITLVCAADLARRAAAVMFNMPAESVPGADVLDAIGELANIVGGNVRALVPEPCHLSLPCVESFTGAVEPDPRVLYELSFTSGGEPFWVRLCGLESPS